MTHTNRYATVLEARLDLKYCHLTHSGTSRIYGVQAKLLLPSGSLAQSGHLNGLDLHSLGLLFFKIHHTKYGSFEREEDWDKEIRPS